MKGAPAPHATAEECVTDNGEITFNPATKLYTSWDECYSEPVCITRFKDVAEAALSFYAEHYL